MSRVSLNTEQAPAASQAILTQINQAFGGVPNMFKAVSNSPAALKSMWGSFGALGAGTLGPQLGELIAVAIANRNKCEYCLAAHTVLGAQAGASAEQLAEAQVGQAQDAKTAAVLNFVLKVVDKAAQIDTADVESLRAQGFADEQIVEILAHIALNIYTNYINVAFDVPVDFPHIALK